ncbi:hypothetical protein TNCV_720341 [Trichonephila clavipes]|nr:hypothetical protein TNCV_720341 [Trichonephila clavipes]
MTVTFLKKKRETQRCCIIQSVGEFHRKFQRSYSGQHDHHRTYGCKPRFVGENRDNSSHAIGRTMSQTRRGAKRMQRFGAPRYGKRNLHVCKFATSSRVAAGCCHCEPECVVHTHWCMRIFYDCSVSPTPCYIYREMIGRDGSVTWPSHSSNLNLLDFFLLGLPKNTYE